MVMESIGEDRGMKVSNEKENQKRRRGEGTKRDERWMRRNEAVSAMRSMLGVAGPP